MSNLTEIAHRHDKDRWRDAGFALLAGLLIAIAIGSVTSLAAGKPILRAWGVTVLEGPIEVMQQQQQPQP
jgi:hypothetical protein